MGLRCLLGHDFGQPETERERNEEGNEVVVTVREVKTCQRCGEKQVVSENKEIKSIDQLRDSVNAGPTGEPSASEPTASEQPTGEPGTGESATSGAEDWGTDGSVGAADEPTSAEEIDTESADQWSTEELNVGGESADAESEEPTEPTEEADEPDEIDKGVAEIIESAEKDDEMLQADSEAEEPESEAEEEDDETPVHPGQRSPDEAAEEPDTSEEDAEILDDDDGPPEEGREQWNEQADPSQVPGGTEREPEAPDGEDALIIDDEDIEESDAEETEPEPATGEPEPSEPEPSETEPAETEPTESESAEPADDGPTAVESEDAVILDDDSDDPEPSEPAEAGDTGVDVIDPTDDDATDDAEETEHMPWPETPGEDEGHDATEPDGEPADVEFGGGLTPEQPRNEDNGTQAGASPESPSPESPASEGSQSTTESGGQSGAETGGPTEAGESGERSGPSAPEPNINLEQSSREAQLEYYCAECGLTRDVGNSSMRAGDICPDCRKGYITEREKSE